MSSSSSSKDPDVIPAEEVNDELTPPELDPEPETPEDMPEDPNWRVSGGGRTGGAPGNAKAGTQLLHCGCSCGRRETAVPGAYCYLCIAHKSKPSFGPKVIILSTSTAVRGERTLIMSQQSL